MQPDPEKIFLGSPQFAAASDGVREALAIHGFTADNDTVQSVALTVLIRFVGAGGLEEDAVRSLSAMMISAIHKVQGHLDLDAIN